MTVLSDTSPMMNDILETDEYIFAEEENPVSWPAIIAGAIVAIVVSLGLLILGSGLGFTLASPFSELDASITAITAGMISWMVVMQWVSSAFGGYIAGRMRSKWSNIAPDETFFRDTAHGLVTWAVATLITALFLTTTVSSIIGTTTQAVATASAGESNSGTPYDYQIDSLLRSGKAAPTTAEGTHAEIARIFAVGLKNDGLSTEDKNYLVQMVSNRTGLSNAEATDRVNTIYTQLDKAKDETTKAAAMFSILGFLSMLVGAFIACVAAALGGRHLYEE
jgi:hypothetical protein